MAEVKHEMRCAQVRNDGCERAAIARCPIETGGDC